MEHQPNMIKMITSSDKIKNDLDLKFISDAEYLSLIDMFDVYHDNFGITYSNRRYHYYIDVSPGAKNGVGALYEESYQKIYDAITPYIREHKINKLI